MNRNSELDLTWEKKQLPVRTLNHHNGKWSIQGQLKIYEDDRWPRNSIAYHKCKAAYLKNDYRCIIFYINITFYISYWLTYGGIWHTIKVTAVVESTWSHNGFFADIIDTPQKSKEQHQKHDVYPAELYILSDQNCKVKVSGSRNSLLQSIYLLAVYRWCLSFSKCTKKFLPLLCLPLIKLGWRR